MSLALFTRYAYNIDKSSSAFGGGILNPCELNVLITALTNQFFQSLTREEFACLSVFLNELSKSMFATALFRDLCDKNCDKKK